MIRIRIGKKKYKGIYRWDDITLRQFCDLAAIPIPAKYEEYIIADGKYNSETKDQYLEIVKSITDEDLHDVFPAYYISVIKVLTNIPDNIIHALSVEKITDLYESYFQPFVLSLLYHAPVVSFMGKTKEYIPPDIKMFRIGLNFYYLPQTVNILDQDIPLADEPIIAYTEASDIFRGMKVSKEDVKRLALFMAIYCRKKGEEYDEKKTLERKELFMNATMDVVWQVFFYTLKRLPDVSMTFQLFGGLPRQVNEVVALNALAAEV